MATSDEIIFGPEKYRPIPAGVYIARILSYEEALGKFNQPVFKVHFNIEENEYKGRVVIALINKNEAGIGGRLWQIKKAVIGSGCEEGDPFRIAECMDKVCVINVEQTLKQGVITGNRVAGIHPLSLLDGLPGGKR